jgi:flagellar biosynthesis protein FliQ
MSETDILEIAQGAIWVTILMSAPLVVPAMLVGVVVAFGQALTQVQENTLTFVPKMVVVFIAMMLGSSFIGSQLQVLTEHLYLKVENGFVLPL